MSMYALYSDQLQEQQPFKQMLFTSPLKIKQHSTVPKIFEKQNKTYGSVQIFINAPNIYGMSFLLGGAMSSHKSPNLPSIIKA